MTTSASCIITRKELHLMSCKLMLGIERVVKDIERQYGIQLDPQYIELLKRPLCSEICHGICQNKYTCHKKAD